MNYFEVFDIEPILNLDLKGLERKFHELSRKHHPDYHTDRPEGERQDALEMTALLNDAYRTLKNPTARAEYLIQTQGLSIDRSKVPQSLLMEVFEINEELDRLRSTRQSGGDVQALMDDLRDFQRQISDKKNSYDRQLEQAFTEWDHLVSRPDAEEKRRQHLSKLIDIISQSSYIRNLERDIEEEVSQ